MKVKLYKYLYKCILHKEYKLLLHYCHLYSDTLAFDIYVLYCIFIYIHIHSSDKFLPNYFFSIQLFFTCKTFEISQLSCCNNPKKKNVFVYSITVKLPLIY